METEKKYPRILQSSVDPTKLSATIQGILLGIIPLVIFIGQQKGVELTYNELVVLVEVFMGMIATVIIFVGTVRKIYVRIFGK